MVRVLGFRVWGQWFGFQGIGSGFWGSGSSVEVLGDILSRDEGVVGLRVLCLRFRVQG